MYQKNVAYCCLFKHIFADWSLLLMRKSVKDLDRVMSQILQAPIVVGAVSFCVGTAIAVYLTTGQRNRRKTEEKPQRGNNTRSGQPFTRTEEKEGNKPLEIHLLIHDISKPRNLKNAIRCAAALGVDKIVLVGQRKQAEMGDVDALLAGCSATRTELVYHKYWGQALAAYGKTRADGPSPTVTLEKHEEGGGEKTQSSDQENTTNSNSHPQKAVFVGLEIVSDSVDSTDAITHVRDKFPECDTIVLLPGNEGTGMSQLERAACDFFVIVRQECRFLSDAPPPSSQNFQKSLAVAESTREECADSPHPATSPTAPTENQVAEVVASGGGGSSSKPKESAAAREARKQSWLQRQQGDVASAGGGVGGGGAGSMNVNTALAVALHQLLARRL